MGIAYSPTQQVSKDGDQVRSTMAHPGEDIHEFSWRSAEPPAAKMIGYEVRFSAASTP